METNKRKYNNIELFAGAGGLALGLEEAGFTPVLLLEKDRDCINTLKKNFKGVSILEEDITKYSEDCTQEDLEKLPKIEELDLISGGCPCQPFSYAGKELGLADTRGTLFNNYAYILKHYSPKMFLFENVKGLLTHDGGKTISTILSVFKGLGYETKYQVLNAWDYGVPQKRERLIVVGIRKDILDERGLSIDEAYKFPEVISPKPVLRDICLSQNPPASECQYYSANKLKYFKLIPAGGNWTNLPKEMAKEYLGGAYETSGGKTGFLRRMSLDEPSLTVLTSPSQKKTERCHPLEIRPFSYKENALIQTFPKEWEFSGSLSSKYKQVGNAVPVKLAFYLGKSMIETLDRL